MTQKLKPFDLEAAKRGEPVCTRDGRKARIICFDLKYFAPIVAAIATRHGGEEVEVYNPDGLWIKSDEYPIDLFMAPKKTTLWLRISKNTDTQRLHYGVFLSELEAKQSLVYPFTTIKIIIMEIDE